MRVRTSLPTSQTWDGWQSGSRNNCAPFLTPQMQQTKQLKTTKTQKQFFCHDQRTCIHSLRSAIARAREFHQRILSNVYRRNTSVQHHLFRKMGESALSKACGAGGRITPTAKPETRKVRVTISHGHGCATSYRSPGKSNPAKRKQSETPKLGGVPPGMQGWATSLKSQCTRTYRKATAMRTGHTGERTHRSMEQNRNRPPHSNTGAEAIQLKTKGQSFPYVVLGRLGGHMQENESGHGPRTSYRN